VRFRIVPQKNNPSSVGGLRLFFLRPENSIITPNHQPVLSTLPIFKELRFISWLFFFSPCTQFAHNSALRFGWCSIDFREMAEEKICCFHCSLLPVRSRSRRRTSPFSFGSGLARLEKQIRKVFRRKPTLQRRLRPCGFTFATLPLRTKGNVSGFARCHYGMLHSEVHRRRDCP
jgi:hypothetical protein